jgi:hypothetical protein
MTQRTFESWMKAVNAAIGVRVGLSTEDLPDVAYRDWFDAGRTPEEMARFAIANAQDLDPDALDRDDPDDGEDDQFGLPPFNPGSPRLG